MAPIDEVPEESPSLDAPARFVRDLRTLYRAEVPVPQEVDGQVLGAARHRVASVRRRLVVIRWAAVASAAAAVLVAAILLHPGPRPSASRGAVVAREDVDRDGEVTILDAFALARGLESSARPPAEWDVNGDGVADRKDVDLVAMAAVRLEGRAVQ
jgi:hypothetical protein